MKKLLLSAAIAVITAFTANAQIVNIPDANFKAYLVGNPAINTNSDTEIQVSEATAFTGTINCPSLSIADMTGIEAFSNITGLAVDYNQLTNLNVSQNTALIELSCTYNQITNLDLSQNTILAILECYQNQLTNLNVSQNTSLHILHCSNNQLSSLDVSNNTALHELTCSHNLLTSLDVSQNTMLNFFYCFNNQLTSLDVSQNTVLNNFFCYGNQITTLDLSNNTALTDLSCHSNQITQLDVSQNTALINLFCFSNQITSLDVSNNTSLTKLNCHTNQLTSLNVANGNNTNFTLLIAFTNPNLSCIQVDDAAYSTANWIGTTFSFDSGVSFNENCSGTTGIADLTLQNIVRIYPNPTSSLLNIEIKEMTNINIVNLLGETVFTQKLNAGNNAIDVSDLTNGVYFIHAANGGAVKFIRE